MPRPGAQQEHRTYRVKGEFALSRKPEQDRTGGRGAAHCRECLSYVPGGVSTCPHCGARLAATRGVSPIVILAGLVLVFGVWALVAGPWSERGSEPREPGETASGAANPAGPPESPGAEGAAAADDRGAGGRVDGDRVDGGRRDGGSMDGAAGAVAGDPGPPLGALGLRREGGPGPTGEATDTTALQSTLYPTAVANAIRKLVFLQFFERGGDLRRECAGVLVDDGRVAVVSAEDLVGAYRGRGWTRGGSFHEVGDVVEYDTRLGLGAVSLAGSRRIRGDGLEVAAAIADDTTPVYAVTSSGAGKHAVRRGTLESVGGEMFFRGPAGERGGVVLSADGFWVGMLLSEANSLPATRVVPATRVGGFLASRMAVALAAFHDTEFEGTARYHLERARRWLQGGEPLRALREYVAAMRIEIDALEGEEVRFGTALLRSLEAARATGQFDPVLEPVEILLGFEGTPRLIYLHAGRLYLDLSRYEEAVRYLGLALTASSVDSRAVRPVLQGAYYDWARSLRRRTRDLDAVSVLQEAITILPNDAVLMLELGRARAAIQDYNGARLALEEALGLDPGMAAVINPELDEIYRHFGDEGVLTIDIPRDTRLIPVDVWLERRAHATLYIDSGASWTFISRELAERLGINPDRVARRGQFSTANGDVSLPVVVLEEVNFRGFVVHNVEAAIGELNSSFGGGVLGNNFLRHFTITIDRPRGKMTIANPR